MNILMNLALLANVVVGIFSVHWAVIGVFAVIHALMRYAYIRQENADSEQAAELQRIQAAMPLIRHIATWVTAIILAAILYGLGRLAMYLVSLVM